ncbi:MAG: AMP-binding protein [Eubacteriales bacterium]|nr:AMP-binding protein [Eubacteriales bacterium]MDD3867082.1 AMP-binding protein [Eubacteriales bacterium]MDD4461168.1 AMP-binding protein [Eubacteriales bacterium]
MRMKQRDYPYYETTKFEDFRIMVENVATRYPDRVAISYKDDPSRPETVDRTYAETRDDVRDLGTGLIRLGLRDQHVALIGEASYDWICSYFALMAIGAVVVPIDRDLPVRDITDIMNAAGCRFIHYSQSIEDKISELRDQVPTLQTLICMGQPERDDAISIRSIVADGHQRFQAGDNAYYDYEIDIERMATIVFTSGTTGKGKGVMLSQKNITLDMTNGMYLFSITPKTINFLPPHHTFGSTVIFVGHFAQGSTIYLSSGLRYIAAEIKEQQPSHLVLVPLFLEKLNARIWSSAEKSGKAGLLRALIRISNGLRRIGIDLRRTLFRSVLEQMGGKLEMVISGGAALNQSIIDTFDGIGITVLNGYGITECAPLVSCNRNLYQKKGSVGVPIIDEEVRIKNPDANGEGEICVRGPNVMLGYYNDPEATAAVFNEEGFFRTGDFGRLDEDGWLYITGRLKNLIILSNGKNVYPEEIEAEIARLDTVEEVIVYAGESRSNRHKEVIVAEIFPNAEVLKLQGIADPQTYFEDQVRQINQTMVSYKAVNMVRLRNEEFPKNTSRKIIRFRIDKSID